MARSLRLTYFGHATVLIEMDGIRILTDPLLRNRVSLLRRFSQLVDPTLYQDIDAIIISHLHIDHLDLPSLQQLNRKASIYLPYGSGKFVNGLGFNRIHEMKIDDTENLGPISIHSTFAKHRHWRYPLGPVADPMGFVLSGSSQIYFTGDTDLFPEMADISNNLDVALLPVWGWGPTISNGHLDPKRAAQALTLLNPQVAIPIHWGTMVPIGLGWMQPRFLLQPPVDFARIAAQLAPAVNVRIVPPGDTMTYEGENFDVDE
jgi:L-ascorbate metabolism protein UlaG (beta-lactamase superfamily)